MSAWIKDLFGCNKRPKYEQHYFELDGKPTDPTLNQMLKRCPWCKTVSICKYPYSGGMSLSVHFVAPDISQSDGIFVEIKNELNMAVIIKELEQLRQFDRIELYGVGMFNPKLTSLGEALADVECPVLDIGARYGSRRRLWARPILLDIARHLVASDNWMVTDLIGVNIVSLIDDNNSSITNDVALQLHRMGSCVRVGCHDKWLNMKNAQWRRRLGSLVALGLCQRGIFHSFLTEGVYDPRIFLVIGSMLATCTTFPHFDTDKELVI